MTARRASTSNAPPRKPANGAGARVPAIVHDVLRTAGQPLDAPTREIMESRFAHDFSQTPVQVARSALTLG